MKKFFAFFLVLVSSFVWSATKINGAGATFPYPIYSKWFSDYHKEKNNIEFNYQSIGSGGGIQQLLKETVDFGASDAPMSDEDLKKAPWPILHIPTVIGSIAIVYNLKGISEPLKMTSDMLVDIFMGKMTSWDDARLQKLNSKVKLPHKDILVVNRADGSGTTAIFTDYMSKMSAEWKTKVGTGKSVSWPMGVGAKGNEGVTGLVQKTEGAIGYVELAYALSNNLAFFSLKNEGGEFVLPSPQTTSFAADSLTQKDYQGDLRLCLVNPKGKKAYPISSFTYILFPLKKNNPQNKEVKEFLLWALSKGQKSAEELHYAPLPKKLSDEVMKKLKAIKE